MSPHETMVKIIELRKLKNELMHSCSENCTSCKEHIHERVERLMQTIGKNVIDNPQVVRDRDMLSQAKELELLELLICNLCKTTCGECKEKVSERLKELCDQLERKCKDCKCK